jgi:hypothetical protein
MKNGDLWRQATHDVKGTGNATKIWGPYGTGEAKDPIDIMIQNTHSSAIVYVNLSGTATVSDTMLKIPAGGTLALENIINDISVIGSISSNVIPYAYCKNGGVA